MEWRHKEEPRDGRFELFDGRRTVYVVRRQSTYGTGDRPYDTEKVRWTCRNKYKVLSRVLGGGDTSDGILAVGWGRVRLDWCKRKHENDRGALAEWRTHSEDS